MQQQQQQQQQAPTSVPALERQALRPQNANAPQRQLTVVEKLAAVTAEAQRLFVQPSRDLTQVHLRQEHLSSLEQESKAVKNQLARAAHVSARLDACAESITDDLREFTERVRGAQEACTLVQRRAAQEEALLASTAPLIDKVNAIVAATTEPDSAIQTELRRVKALLRGKSANDWRAATNELRRRVTTMNTWIASLVPDEDDDGSCTHQHNAKARSTLIEAALKDMKSWQAEEGTGAQPPEVRVVSHIHLPDTAAIPVEFSASLLADPEACHRLFAVQVDEVARSIGLASDHRDVAGALTAIRFVCDSHAALRAEETAAQAADATLCTAENELAELVARVEQSQSAEAQAADQLRHAHNEEEALATRVAALKVRVEERLAQDAAELVALEEACEAAEEALKETARRDEEAFKAEIASLRRELERVEGAAAADLADLAVRTESASDELARLDAQGAAVAMELEAFTRYTGTLEESAASLDAAVARVSTPLSEATTIALDAAVDVARGKLDNPGACFSVLTDTSSTGPLDQSLEPMSKTVERLLDGARTVAQQLASEIEGLAADVAALE